jgi:ribosomal protein S12 methylthiotransferase accessory factor YcaO
MVNSTTRYIKVIEAKATQAVQAAATPKTQRALSRALAEATQNSYFLY